MTRWIKYEYVSIVNSVFFEDFNAKCGEAICKEEQTSIDELNRQTISVLSSIKRNIFPICPEYPVVCNIKKNDTTDSEKNVTTDAHDEKITQLPYTARRRLNDEIEYRDIKLLSFIRKYQKAQQRKTVGYLRKNGQSKLTLKND